MTTNRAGYSFVALGFVSLAAGIACLGWASSLGGFGFIAATAAVFVALLSFTRFAGLRRQALTDTRSIPMPDRLYESSPAPIMPSRGQDDDAELEARLAALRAPQAQPFDVPYIAPREPDPSVTVIEGAPMEPEFADMLPAAPEPAPAAAVPSCGLRQMDELRAEIARLREGARLRHAGVGVAQPQIVRRDARDEFPRTEFSGLTQEAPLEPSASDQGPAFPRTEFSGLESPRSEEAGFSKTEYLGPVELRRSH